MMMDTWMAPRPGGEATPVPCLAPGRAVPASPESAEARAKLQPTVYLPTRTADQRHVA